MFPPWQLKGLDLSHLFEPDNLVDAEEIGRTIGESIVVPTLTVEERPKETIIVDKQDFPVVSVFKIIDEDTSGELIEMTIRSPSSDFSIDVISDNRVLLSRAYTDLTPLSPQSNWIDAFQEAGGGDYVLHLTELHWAHSFYVAVVVSTTITFSNIWAVYKLRSELARGV